MFRFEINNGISKEIDIVGDYYTDELLCEQKATETLLKKGYSQVWINFKTVKQGLKTNDIVRVGGVLYKIKLLKTIITDKITLFEVEAVRFNN